MVLLPNNIASEKALPAVPAGDLLVHWALNLLVIATLFGNATHAGSIRCQDKLQQKFFVPNFVTNSKYNVQDNANNLFGHFGVWSLR